MMTLAPRRGGSDEYCSLLASVDSLQLFFVLLSHTPYFCVSHALPSS